MEGLPVEMNEDDVRLLLPFPTAMHSNLNPLFDMSAI